MNIIYNVRNGCKEEFCGICMMYVMSEKCTDFGVKNAHNSASRANNCGHNPRPCYHVYTPN